MKYKRVHRVIVMDYYGPSEYIDAQLQSRWIKTSEHEQTANPYVRAHEEIQIEETEDGEA